MTTRTEKIKQLQRKVANGGRRKTAALVGAELAESGLLDHAVLDGQIAAILEGLSGNPALGRVLERHLDGFLGAVQQDQIQETAQHVCALLRLELDDLRKAALLSLMVRLAGKRKFDPVAAYILKHRARYAASGSL